MSTNTESQGNALDTLKWGLVVLILAGAVVGNGYFSTESVLIRAVAVVVAIAVALFIATQTAKGKAAVDFAVEARNEVRKVVWPTRAETVQTTGIVFAVTALVGFCLWLLDMGLVAIVNLITGV